MANYINFIMNKNNMIHSSLVAKTWFFPLENNNSEPVDFTAWNEAQLLYLFGDEDNIHSGVVSLISFTGKDSIKVLTYFSSFSGRVEAIELVKGPFSITHFVDFIVKVHSINVITPVLYRLGANGYEPSKSLILVPKNFARDWVYKKLDELNIEIKPYLWKDETLPQTVKDIHKTIVEAKTPNIDAENPINIVNAISKAHTKIQLKLERLASVNSTAPQTSSINSSSPLTNRYKDSFNPLAFVGKRRFSTTQYNLNETSKYVRTIAEVNTKVVNPQAFTKLVNLMSSDVLKKVGGEKYNLVKISVLAKVKFKVKDEDDFEPSFAFKSLSYLDVIIANDFKVLPEVYFKIWDKRFNYLYHDLEVAGIVLDYKILDPGFKRKFVTAHIINTIAKGYTPEKVNLQLPKTMDLQMWGHYKFSEFTMSYVIETNIKGAKDISVQVSESGGRISHIGVINYIWGFSSPKFVDYRDTEDRVNTFTRHFIDLGIKFFYINGVEVGYEEPSNSKGKFIDKLKPQKVDKNTFKIMTMDIETRELNGVLDALCLSLFHKSTDIKSKESFVTHTFTLDEYKSQTELIRAALDYVLRRKFNGYKIYLHNFSGFDSYFILKSLINHPRTSVNILARDGKLLKVTVSFTSEDNKTKSKYSITFIDSFLILPTSLDKLIKALNLSDKGLAPKIFPLKFLNQEVLDWDYKGPVPSLKYFFTPDTLNVKEYNNFINKYDKYKSRFKVWNMKSELVNYCENDVKALYFVIIEFFTYMHKEFKVNASKYPTTPSLAFAAWRVGFLEHDVPCVTGTVYSDIKNAYYGGIVDVYKPFGRRVLSYDVNSLYPSVMSKCLMPIGKHIYFEGERPLKDVFGYVQVDVEAPNIKTPFLPLKTENGTIYPTGTWSGWYFTEELKNAELYGYKFKIKKGYIFEKANIFYKYVEAIYKIKQNSTPGSFWYIIAKLLLNSLYGRFGMDPDVPESKIIAKEHFDSWNNSNHIKVAEIIDLDENLWVKYSKFENTSVDKNHNLAPNISVPIAAAVTAYARIDMSKYIMDNPDRILYIDTDGIKITKKLPEDQVGPELGKMKYEGYFDYFISIAPKVYGGISKTEMVAKCKGLVRALTYWHMEYLLWNKHLNIPHFKWFRNFVESNIKINEINFSLTPTDNKRNFVYDSMGRIVGTTPYKVDGGVIIKVVNPIFYYLPLYKIFILIEYIIPFLQFPYFNLFVKSVIKFIPAPVKYLLLANPVNYKYPVLPNLHLIDDKYSVEYLTGTLKILPEEPYITILPEIPYEDDNSFEILTGSLSVCLSVKISNKRRIRTEYVGVLIKPSYRVSWVDSVFIKAFKLIKSFSPYITFYLKGLIEIIGVIFIFCLSNNSTIEEENYCLQLLLTSIDDYLEQQEDLCKYIIEFEKVEKQPKWYIYIITASVIALYFSLDSFSSSIADIVCYTSNNEGYLELIKFIPLCDLFPGPFSLEELIITQEWLRLFSYEDSVKG